jgi:hypothetical protein
MDFEHFITVRSQPGKNADYGRALERIAFFPGVTRAMLIGEDIESVTIGYNGSECVRSLRRFRSDLDADDLEADCPLWDGSPALNVQTVDERVHGRGAVLSRAFDRRL